MRLRKCPRGGILPLRLNMTTLRVEAVLIGGAGGGGGGQINSERQTAGMSSLVRSMAVLGGSTSQPFPLKTIRAALQGEPCTWTAGCRSVSVRKCGKCLALAAGGGRPRRTGRYGTGRYIYPSDNVRTFWLLGSLLHFFSGLEFLLLHRVVGFSTLTL